MAWFRQQPGNIWQWSFSSVSGTAPANTWGTAVTPGSNADGTAVSIVSSGNMAQDALLVLVGVNSVAINATATSTLVDLLVDPGGGTSWSTLAASILCSEAAGMTSGIPTMQVFPVWIKAGSSLGAMARQNVGSPAAIRVWIKVFGKPARPQDAYAGTYVRTYGDVRGSSCGTAVTPGNGSEGSWTSLGAVSDPIRAWGVAAGLDNATTSGRFYTIDLGVGDGSNKQVVLEDRQMVTTSAEIAYASAPQGWANGWPVAASGNTAYGRAQGNAASDSGFTMIAYGTG